MEKWNNTEIIIKYILSCLFLSKRDTQIYKNLYAVLHNKFDKDTLNIRDNDEIDFNEAKIYFITALEYIPDDLYSTSLDLFLKYNDFTIFNNPINLKRFPIDNKMLLKHVYEVLETTEDKELLKYFKYLCSHNKINIIDNDPTITQTNTQRLGGFTTSSSLFNESYINLFRTNTLEDIEILVHEIFHAYFFYIDNDHKDDFHRLQELEGLLGSMLAFNYLDDKYTIESLKLRESQVNSMLSHSFLTIVNHALCANYYDINRTNEYLNKTAPELELEILDEELPNYLTIQGFQSITNIISYLIILDFYNKYNDSKVLYNIIKHIKSLDTHDLKYLYNYNDLTFFKDDFTSFDKEYKRTRI